MGTRSRQPSSSGFVDPPPREGASRGHGGRAGWPWAARGCPWDWARAAAHVICSGGVGTRFPEPGAWPMAPPRAHKGAEIKRRALSSELIMPARSGARVPPCFGPGSDARS